METLITSLSTGFQGVVTDALSAVGTVAPIALPILGAIIVITIAIRTFKKSSN